MSKVGEYLGLVEELHHEAEAAFAKLPVNTRGIVTTTLASLYASIFAFADTGLFLLRHNKEAGLSAIGRSTLEAWVDLKNLAADDGYLDRMEASFYHEYIKMLEDGATGNNPYSAGFANNASVTQGLADFKTRLDKLKQKGSKPMTVRDKFDGVGMINIYTAVYNQLCAEGHNNMRALRERHWDVVDGEVNITVFKEPRENHLLTMIDLFADPLRAGLASIYQNQDATLPDSFLDVEKRLLAFRDTLGT